MESLIDPSYETISAERTWRYFTEELSDGKSIEVKCNLCNVLFPDSPGILTYLTRHLNFVHKNEIIEDDIYPEFGLDSNIETDGSENVFPDYQQHFNYFDGGKNSLKTSLTLEYFTINNNSKAKCKICSKVLSYNPRSDFNLSRHLRDVHFDYITSLNLDFISSNRKKSNGDIQGLSGETGLKLIKTNPYFENINKILENDFELKNYFKLENESLVCIKCSEVFNICNEILLKEHVQIYHSKWQVLCSENINSNLKDNDFKMAEDKIDLVDTSIVTNRFPFNKLKITEKYKNIWKYCSQLSSSNITCNFCVRVFTYSSKIKWNIYRHLFYKHALQMDKDDLELFINNNPSLCRNKLLLEKKIANSFSSLKAALIVPNKLNLDVKTPSPQKKDTINTPKTSSLSKIKNTLKNSKPKKAFVVSPSLTSPNCVKYDSDEEYDHIKTKKNFIVKIGRTWSHFTKVHLGKAICNMCHMSIHYFGNGGDVLNKHLDDYHVKKDQNLENSYSLKNCNIENESNSNKSAIKKGDQTMSINKNSNNNTKKLTIEEDNNEIHSTFSENENKVWMFFTKTDNGIAKCQLCLKLILYNDKIFYLILHLHQTHSVISIPLPNNENIASDKEKVLAAVDLSPKKSLQNRIVMQNVDLNTLNESPLEKQQLLKKSKGINLWTYYSQLNKKDQAKCKICDKCLSYKGGSTYNLHRHLCNVHNIKLAKREDEVKKLHNKGDTWSYYTQITQDYALCNICNKQLSHKGGRFSNLERHLSNVHKIKTSKINSRIPKIDDSGSKNIKTVKNVKMLHFCKSKKNILSFFAKLHRDSLKCKLCKKHIFCRGLYIKRLMDHLWSGHINKFMTFNNKNIRLLPKEIGNVKSSKIIKGYIKNTVIKDLDNCNTKDENIVILTNNSKAQIVKQPIKSSKRTGITTSNKTVMDFKCNEPDNSPIKNSSSQDQIIKQSNQIVKFPQTNEKSLPIVLKNSTDKKCATTKRSDSKQTNILYNKNNIHHLETKYIWQFFVKVGKSKVQCIICNNQKSMDRKITNLKRHLSSVHKNGNSFPKNNTFDNEISPNKMQMIKRLSTKSIKVKCKLCFRHLICKNISEQLKLIKHLKVHNKELLREENLMLVKYSDKNYNLKNKNVNDNNHIVDNNILNKTLNRYFKCITILKNKCKICHKFVSSKIKCTHLVNGGFGISYGLGNKRFCISDDKKLTGNSNYNIQFHLPLNKCSACDIISKKKGFCCHSIKDLIVDRFKDTSEYGVDNSDLKPMTDNSDINRAFQISNTPIKMICDSNKRMKSIEKFFNVNPGNSLSNSILNTIDKSPTIAALKTKHDIKDESKIINLNKSIVLKDQVNRSFNLSSCEVVQQEVIIDGFEDIDRIRNYSSKSDFKQSVNLQSLLVNILINKNIISFVNLKGDKQFAECNLCKKCLLLRKPIIRNFISHLYFKHKNEIH